MPVTFCPKLHSGDVLRTVITLWYYPFFALLPDGLRAHIARPRKQHGWSEEAWKRIAELIPVYEGAVEPTAWNRSPGPALK